MDINLIIIPIIIIATAYYGHRYSKQGIGHWYESLEKPKWTPAGSLIREIWIFLYVLTGLAILWYYNVPVVGWLHYVVGAILLVNAYLNATWNKVFFVQHDIPKAYKHIIRLNITAIAATVLMFIASPIASVLMLPYVIWIFIATRITKEIMNLNHSK